MQWPTAAADSTRKPGWYLDPLCADYHAALRWVDPSFTRWWDGSTWTEDTHLEPLAGHRDPEDPVRGIVSPRHNARMWWGFTGLIVAGGVAAILITIVQLLTHNS